MLLPDLGADHAMPQMSLNLVPFSTLHQNHIFHQHY